MNLKAFVLSGLIIMKFIHLNKDVFKLFRFIKNNIVILIAVTIVLTLFFIIKKGSNDDELIKADNFHDEEWIEIDGEDEQQPFLNENQIVVDIKGEVKRPGVYQFENGARVNDLVNKAGGFLQTADETQVNLAQKLQDEMIVIVPRKIDGSSHDHGAIQSSHHSDIVKVNYATEEELQTLPGIGPAKAKAIADYRDEHGFFSRPEDLLNVSGIGEKTLENLIEYIQIP